MKECYRTNIAGYDIILQQRERSPKLFNVVYGQQHFNYLEYNQATTALGECILHALACEEKLDNECD